MLHIEDYLKDKKENILTPLDTIMGFYNNKNICHLEEKKHNEVIYKELGWDSQNYFDAITSFWIIFKHIIYIKFKFNAYKKSYTRMYYSGKYPKIFKNINYLCKEFDDIEKLSKYCHSVANFMPCPQNFNMTKGCLEDVKDFFPLMIDKIQKCIDENKEIEFYKDYKKILINIEEIKEWHKFFIENYDKYCLDMYYSVKEYGDSKKLIGKKFFKYQSLRNPFPKSDDQIKECLAQMINCIKIRAEKLYNITSKK